MKAKPFLYLIAATAALSLMAFGCQTANTSAAVTLKPGDDVAGIVAASPEGTTFYFGAGLYRIAMITPRDGQRFIGKGTTDANATILSGARPLKNWQKEGPYWVASGLPDQLHRSGYCGDKSNRCTHREDLFVDGKVQRFAAELGEVDARTWFAEGDKAYLGFDPAGRNIEIGLTPYAFAGPAKDITIQNLVVERFASEAQRGAIEGTDGDGWQLIDVVARWNHGGGVSMGKRMRISGGAYIHNGQIGMVGEGDEAVVENVEIAFNNYANYNWGWEAGGTKFWRSDGLVIRNTCVHDNEGPGIWTDIDNINVLIENNKVFRNEGDGIKHEISYKATIQGNTVALNGKGKDNWLWGSQILVQNSRDVTVRDNYVEVPANFGNGISLIHQDRGDTGAHGKWITANTKVYDNTIVFMGDRGATGLVADFEREIFETKGNNSFNGNTYVIRSANQPFFQESDGNLIPWSRLEDYGREPDAKLIVESRKPVRLQCER
jgi:parallel beta-helix repeat protein